MKCGRTVRMPVAEDRGRELQALPRNLERFVVANSLLKESCVVVEADAGRR
ncbi:MAG: hypothetical protein IPM29_23250 [Planctomycetes bacterium]|nr:hypothetical protein [Planctomycetota bacterium]